MICTERKRRMLLLIVVMILLVIVIGIVVAVWLVLPIGEQGKEVNEEAQSSSFDSYNTPELDETVEMLDITTPYGVLNYPAQFADRLYHETTTQEGTYTHTFYFVKDVENIEMFSVYFGSAETGTLIGYIMENGECIAVTVDSTDFEPDATWSEAESLLYYAMVDSINDVIASVTSNQNFLA